MVSPCINSANKKLANLEKGALAMFDFDTKEIGSKLMSA